MATKRAKPTSNTKAKARGVKAKPTADEVAERATEAAIEQAAKPATPAKLSALDAAVKVLGEEGKAMNCQELIGIMAGKGYWSSPAGKTPAATLYSAILRELNTKGDRSRFRKVGRGSFTLNDHG